jgi:hypothetical protein
VVKSLKLAALLNADESHLQWPDQPEREIGSSKVCDAGESGVPQVQKNASASGSGDSETAGRRDSTAG